MSDENTAFFFDFEDNNVLCYVYEKPFYITADYEEYKDLNNCILDFKPEPENEYDNRAVAIYAKGIKLGYVFRGANQDMINDYIEKGWYFKGFLSKISPEEQMTLYKIGFYKPFDYVPNKTYTLIKTKKKIDDFENRMDNLSMCGEDEQIRIDYDYDCENYVVYSATYTEIGELPSSAASFIDENEHTAILGYISSLESDYDDNYSAKVKIFAVKQNFDRFCNSKKDEEKSTIKNSICPNCGKTSNSKFCPDCGTPIEASKQVTNTKTPDSVQPVPTASTAQPQKKKNNLTIIAVIAVLIFIISVCFIIHYAVNSYKTANINASDNASNLSFPVNEVLDPDRVIFSVKSGRFSIDKFSDYVSEDGEHYWDFNGSIRGIECSKCITIAPISFSDYTIMFTNIDLTTQGAQDIYDAINYYYKEKYETDKDLTFSRTGEDDTTFDSLKYYTPKDLKTYEAVFWDDGFNYSIEIIKSAKYKDSLTIRIRKD